MTARVVRSLEIHEMHSFEEPAERSTQHSGGEAKAIRKKASHKADSSRPGSVSTADLNPVSQHFRTKGRGKTRRISAETTSSGFRKHSRYLTDFSEPIIRIDVGHHQANRADAHPKIFLLDCDTAVAPVCGGNSIYSAPQVLSKFPETIGALKIALNSAAQRTHLGSTRSGVNNTYRTTLRLMGWMARRNIYRLSDLTQDDTRELIDQVAKFGWTEILEQTKIVKALLELAAKDTDVFAYLYGRISNSGKHSLPIKSIEILTGLPIHAESVPLEIYKLSAKVEGDKRPVKRTPSVQRTTKDALKSLVQTLNSLALTTPGSIPFLPYPKANAEIERAYKVAKTAEKNRATNLKSGATATVPKTSFPTPNLSTNECIKIFTESARWVYDYSKVILSTYEYAKKLLKGQENSPHAQNVSWEKVYNYYEREAALVGIPKKSLNGRIGEDSFFELLDLLHEACLEMLAINTARRINELLGRNGVPYGLYLGALKKMHSDLDVYALDSYVCKGPQDWFMFPANQLVVDAYRVLQRLYELNECYGTRKPQENAPLAEARKRKLFSHRKLSPKGLSTGVRTSYAGKSRKAFFSIAGVDATKIENTQAPFRRIFCVLFMHRYDMPEEGALAKYLGHLTMSTVAGYYRDKIERDSGASIRELYAPHYYDAEFFEEMEVARTDFMTELILKMLNGEPVAGGFPVVVAKLAKKLSENTDFSILTNELKAGVLATKARSDGHSVDPIKHTNCMAGQPRKTGERAKCYRSGSLHMEEASPKLCSNCVHSCCTQSSIANMKADLIESNKFMESTSESPIVKKAHSNRFRCITEAIEDAGKAIKRNRDLFARAEEAWTATVARSPKFSKSQSTHKTPTISSKSAKADQ